MFSGNRASVITNPTPEYTSGLVQFLIGEELASADPVRARQIALRAVEEIFDLENYPYSVPLFCKVRF
jgi:hypothetical protein